MSKSRTLPSRARANVLRAYRSRGHANRNIWLIYSLKTNRDWILESDRHLVHWLMFLETNPEVRHFNIPSAESREKSEIGVDAEVERQDGALEYHRLLLNSNAEGKRGEVDKLLNSQDGKRTRVFTEADLFPLGEEAMRWLKVLGYCAAIRDEEQTEATVAAISFMRGLDRGTLRDVVESMQDFDPQIAIGVVARMAVLSDIAVDLSASGYTLTSQWAWRQRG
jgi:hypothetical protein